MSPEDRGIVDRIETTSKDTNKVVRALSASLIGRVNGDTVDDTGGRIGRLEKNVQMLMDWRWYLTISILSMLGGGLIYFLKTYFERHP